MKETYETPEAELVIVGESIVTSGGGISTMDPTFPDNNNEGSSCPFAD